MLNAIIKVLFKQSEERLVPGTTLQGIFVCIVLRA